MDLSSRNRKEIGALGESVAVEYLRRRGMQIIARNVTRKTGELDVIACEEDILHIVEVKTLVINEFPRMENGEDVYDPSVNLHAYKIRKVARTAEWYVLDSGWEGDWQVDGCLVWLRRRDGKAFVRFFPQIA